MRPGGTQLRMRDRMLYKLMKVQSLVKMRSIMRVVIQTQDSSWFLGLHGRWRTRMLHSCSCGMLSPREYRQDESPMLLTPAQRSSVLRGEVEAGATRPELQRLMQITIKQMTLRQLQGKGRCLPQRLPTVPLRIATGRRI